MSSSRRARTASTGKATQATRAALLEAATAALSEDGFAGASARNIADRAGSTQSQVFYHFGTVVDLLVAALEDVSARRLETYRPLVETSSSPAALVRTARVIVTDDLGSSDLRVLAEMITAAQSDPDLGRRVDGALRPWFELVESSVAAAARALPLPGAVPTRDVAFGLVAWVLGTELLTGVTGDAARATSLLESLDRLVSLVSGFTGMPSTPTLPDQVPEQVPDQVPDHPVGGPEGDA